MNKRIEFTTDALFNTLPNFINIDGKLYHFGLIKGNKNIIVWYRMNESEGGEYLGNTSRDGDNLNEALRNMLDWLIKFDYLTNKSNNIVINKISNYLKKKFKNYVCR